MKKHRLISLLPIGFMAITLAAFDPLCIASLNTSDTEIADKTAVQATAPIKKDTADSNTKPEVSVDTDEPVDAPVANGGIYDSFSVIYTDTDGDGLTDDIETRIYKTDPLVFDTDGDGLSDGCETVLGLDPLDVMTDGKSSDFGRVKIKTLDTNNISPALTEDLNAAVPSLDVTAYCDIDESFLIKRTASADFADGSCVVGEVVDIIGDEMFAGTLRFDLGDTADDGFFEYMICRYGENGDIKYLKTKYDAESGGISADIKESGTYFVLNTAKLLSKAGIGIDSGAAVVSKNVPDSRGYRIFLDGPIPIPVYLDAEPCEGSDTDTDGDGIPDVTELGGVKPTDAIDLDRLLYLAGIKNTSGKPFGTLKMYSFISSPVDVDTDFDGIDDGADAYPRDNRFTGRMASYGSDGKPLYADNKGLVSFRVDHRLFYFDNTEYNMDIAALSSLFAIDIYENTEEVANDSDTDVTVDGLLEGEHTPEELARVFGYRDVKRINIGYEDSDRTEILIGHHPVEYLGKKREIILISVRGTNGSFEEWSSNFDVGADTNEYLSMTGEHPEWTDRLNHKGFDVTANRVMAAVSAYLSDTAVLDADAEPVYWITGHSRGAAVANIMGAKYEREGKITYVYTFASPNTTTDQTASEVKSVFNVINGDDLIPLLPLTEKWGFCRYGTDRITDVSELLGSRTPLSGVYKKGIFKDTFGIDYNDNEKNGQLIEEFLKIAESREALYVFTYEDDSLVISGKNHSTAESAASAADKRKNKLPDIFGQLGDYRYIEEKTASGALVYKEGCYQTTAYFMQALAYLASNEGAVDLIIGGRLVELADRYTDARNYFVITFLSGMSHPHWMQTYYLIASGAFPYTTE